MKLAVVFEDNGDTILMAENEPVVIPVFQWIMIHNTDKQWRMDICAFLFALTKGFQFQKFRGYIALGWNKNPVRPFFELNVFGSMRVGG